LRRVTVVSPLNQTVTTTYDAASNVVMVSEPPNSPALTFSTRYAYDALNQQTQVIQRIDPNTGLGQTTWQSYDPAGNRTSVLDPLGNRTAYRFDAVNRLVVSIDPRGGRTTTTYDAESNPLQVSDPEGNSTRYHYDALGRRDRTTDTFGFTATAAYDTAGNLTSSTDRLGRRRDFSYDALNRQTGEAWAPAGGGTAVPVATLTYDTAGNLTGSASPAGAYTFSYDALNRVKGSQQPFGVTLTATYDAAGRRTLLQDSLGGTATSVYDNGNRLTSRQFSVGGATPVRVDQAWTPRNQVGTVTYYNDLAGQSPAMFGMYTYNDLGQLSTLLWTHDRTRPLDALFNGGPGYNGVESLFDRYDRDGRLMYEQRSAWRSASDPGSGQVNPAFSYAAGQNYSYDPSGEVLGDGTTVYTYSPDGNRSTGSEVYGPGNQLLQDANWAYRYDREGNLVEQDGKPGGSNPDSRWLYSYDNANRLIAAEQRKQSDGSLVQHLDYRYDAFGQLLERDWQGTGSPGSYGQTPVQRYVWDGGQVLADLDNSNAVQVRYVRGDGTDQPWARVDASNGVLFYLSNTLGSVIDLIGAQGGARVREQYDPFGRVVAELASVEDRLKYTARDYDYATELQYNRQRWYDPITGRWQSPDPLGQAAGDTNLYRYGGNSPLNRTDPSGLLSQDSGGGSIDEQLNASRQRLGLPPLPESPGYWSTLVSAAGEGLSDGWAITRDTLMLGTNEPLHQYVEQKVAENGGWYRAAQASSVFGRDLLLATVPVAGLYNGLGCAAAKTSTLLGFLGYHGSGAVVGGVKGYWQTSLAGDRADGYDYALGTLFGAVYGGADPLTTAFSFAAEAGAYYGAKGWGRASEESAQRWMNAAGIVSTLIGAGIRGELRGGPRGLREALWPDVGAVAVGLGFGVITDTDPLAAANRALTVVNAYRAGKELWSRACFAAGTPLRTPAGSKRIEEFAVGDVLLTRDESSPECPVVQSVVEEVFVRVAPILHLHLQGQVIRTTAEHPFCMRGKGWTPVGELRPGDELASEDERWLRVEEVLETGEWEKVYNLRVADYHTYFVGCLEWGFSVWAHNQYQPDPKDVGAYIAQRKNGAVDWKSINPELTIKQQSAVRAAARGQGVEIPTPNPYGKTGDPISKRTGTYMARELEAQGFNVEREARFLAPDAPSGRAYRDVDVLAINPQTREATIVQVVRTTDQARLTPHPREFTALNEVMASPAYQRLIDQGYTINSYMVRRGATRLDSALRIFSSE
jgi:RHS repeat-associated protein